MAIKPEDVSLSDFRPSCTEDEAVARMLDWMRGFSRKKIIKLNRFGVIPADELAHLSCLEGTLEEMLNGQRSALQQDLFDTLSKDCTDEEILEKDDAVSKFDEEINKAGVYRAYIADELNKGESSALRIDRKTTEETGITHITLISLDEWARKQFGIPIIGSLESTSSAFNQSAESQQKNNEERTIGKTKSDNLYTTLAFLAEALSEKSPKFEHGGKPNASAIALHIEELVQKANGGQSLTGQDSETIRKVITEAINVKKRVMFGKGNGN